jgi:cobalt/nickel transport system permease protein
MDGGLLALGCNIFNLGFFPAFVAYPLVYRPFAKGGYASPRAWAAAVAAAVLGLQLGALGVVLETRASGLSELPFGTFLLLMSPIHLAIGAVEGLATAAVVAFVARARPEALPDAAPAGRSASLRSVLAGLAVAAAVVGGGLSWFASTRPDGLEWSLAKAAGQGGAAGAESGLHRRLAALQGRTAVLPDYGFKAEGAPAAAETWPAVKASTSVSGLAGGLITLAVVLLIGLALRRRRPAHPERA